MVFYVRLMSFLWGWLVWLNIVNALFSLISYSFFSLLAWSVTFTCLSFRLACVALIDSQESSKLEGAPRVHSSSPLHLKLMHNNKIHKINKINYRCSFTNILESPFWNFFVKKIHCHYFNVPSCFGKWEIASKEPRERVS